MGRSGKTRVISGEVAGGHTGSGGVPSDLSADEPSIQRPFQRVAVSVTSWGCVCLANKRHDDRQGQ